VIVCRWIVGAADHYLQAAANTRVVGALIGELIRLINQHHSIAFGRFAIVGFSLGAHAAAFAGQSIQRHHRLPSTEYNKIAAIYGTYSIRSIS